MGRAPCCDKANVKRGPWSPEEDSTLKSYIEQYGTGGNWIALPQKIGLKRCGKSCRLRWLNYLRPNIKHGGFSEEEDNIICSLYMNIGSRWSIIAGQLAGRTDNDIKNYWNTKLKKKLLGKHRSKDQKVATRRKVANNSNNVVEAYNTVPQQQQMTLPANQTSLQNMVYVEDNHHHQNQPTGISFANPNYSAGLYSYDQVPAAAYLNTMVPSNSYGYQMYDHDLMSNVIQPPFYDLIPGIDDQLDIIPAMMNYSGDNLTGTTSPAESTTSWSDMTSNGVVYSPPMGYYNLPAAAESTGNISHDGNCVFHESSDFRMHQQFVLQQ